MKKVKKPSINYKKFVAYPLVAILVIFDRGVAAQGYQTFLHNMSNSQRNGIGVGIAILVFVVVVYLIIDNKK